MSEWKPIDTAPKTDRRNPYRGYVLLVSFPKGFVAVGDAQRPPRDYFTTYDGQYHAPTHWAEIPAAPPIDP